MFERLIIGIALVGVASTSAFATVVGVPGPIVGAGLPGIVVGGVALYAWYRNRKTS